MADASSVHSPVWPLSIARGSPEGPPQTTALYSPGIPPALCRGGLNYPQPRRAQAALWLVYLELLVEILAEPFE